MEIKESYKERLSESGDNSRLIVMIRANWMTLEFSNALPRLCACVCVRACMCSLYVLYVSMRALVCVCVSVQACYTHIPEKIRYQFTLAIFSIRNSVKHPRACA